MSLYETEAVLLYGYRVTGEEIVVPSTIPEEITLVSVWDAEGEDGDERFARNEMFVAVRRLVLIHDFEEEERLISRTDILGPNTEEVKALQEVAKQLPGTQHGWYLTGRKS